jgi:hypothetical protein
MQVCVRDETASGQSLWELSLEFLSERITVRELLRERVVSGNSISMDLLGIATWPCHRL